ncbi:MAG TPA: cytochrome c3 family protein, partial [Candidatus Saccharimonadales bacterium]|nr:cytochrome c3 family protein [Candidatus Saccharimonadales bacterium]
MARKPTFGTPDQSKAYVFPDRRRWRGLIGVIGVVAVLVFFGVDLFTGDKTFLTAGPLSKAHAVAGADCAKCHQSWHRPPDRLCIGCHDPLASVTRFGALAHAERSKSATKRPDHEPRCVFCHTEHLGRATPVSAVANEACASCHGFRSFGSGHPEFRPLRGSFEVATGIKFSHKKHLREMVGAARGKPLADDEEPEPAEEAKQCGACHKPALDNGDFMTVSFDADCSRCHFDKTGTLGATDPVSADLVATPEQLMAAKPAPAWIQAYKDDFEERRGRISKTVL